MADRGAQLIVVPAAFNMTTGPAHWELLFRMRAVDNQIFTLGTAPARNEAEKYVSYANSILADPWGYGSGRGPVRGRKSSWLKSTLPEIKRFAGSFPSAPPGAATCTDGKASGKSP